MDYLQVIESVFIILFVPMVWWLKSISESVKGLLSGQNKLVETCAAEHKSESENNAREGDKMMKAIMLLEKDLGNKVGKIMDDHASHDKVNTEVNTKLDEVLSRLREGK